jgi:hypothetical protein
VLSEELESEELESEELESEELESEELESEELESEELESEELESEESEELESDELLSEEPESEDFVSDPVLSDDIATGTTTAARSGAPSTKIASRSPVRNVADINNRRARGSRRARSVVSMPVTSRRASPDGGGYRPIAITFNNAACQGDSRVPRPCHRPGRSGDTPPRRRKSKRTPCPGRICAARSTSASQTVASTG